SPAMMISALTFGAIGAAVEPTSRYPSSCTIKFAALMRVFASARKRRRPLTSTHASLASLATSYTTSWRAETRILSPAAGTFPVDQVAGLDQAPAPTLVTVA